MRPFQCLDGPSYSLCHLPYPYALERRLTTTDLADLEYELLFLRKLPGEYGIDPRNGVYYRLAWREGGIEGRVFEADLSKLAVPPAEGVKRPVTAEDLYEPEPGRHWLPRIAIGTE